jgi:acetyl/propionyl-CoA carboxylase alpha subunit/acetyl-CoA carboxylase carboxyltransferase component
VKESFTRLAIVNRGEAAMRLVHAARELNEERERQLHLIALYTEPEAQAMFVRRSDEGYCLGPATYTAPDGSRRAGYLDYDALERALRETGAEAAWVGWGFVAEHPAFAELCERLGVVFVGPSSETMRLLGDKIRSKQLAEAAGVPVAPWSGGPVDTLEEAAGHAKAIGYPLMIKATAGGGGRGIRRVDGPNELALAFERARAEAEQAFGDPTVLIERLITAARHVEVQAIADGAGAAWAVGVRDCSLQRRHQKVIEESASTALTPEQEEQAKEAGRRLVLDAGYRGAATVEFLYEPAEQRLSFMEVNARLQVEHPVTEMTTGLDLVKLQLHVASGGRLEGDPPPAAGHAVEARLNAEDPAMDFAPSPGRVELLNLPSGPGLRVDRGMEAGDEIPPDFDSMIAKLIAHGRDRDEAIARLRRALRETTVLIEDGSTNRGFLLQLLDHPDVLAGRVDTTWLDRHWVKAGAGRPAHADVALLQAVLELAEAEEAADRSRFYAYARRGRPEARAEVGHTIDLAYDGQSYRLRVFQLAPGRFGVTVDGSDVEVEVERLSDHERRLAAGGRSHRTVISEQGTHLLVEVDGAPHRVAHDEGGIVRSHAPGVVVSIPVAEGEDVEAGAVVAVLESMKMESSLTAPRAGRVRRVLVGPNTQVGARAPLVQIDELGDGEAPKDGERVEFAPGPADLPQAPLRCVENLRRLEWLILGYDVSAADVTRVIADLHGECADLSCSPELIPGEHRLLRQFADLRALTRPRHEEDPEGELLRSPQEYLHAFLRSLDAESEGLPERFVALLRRSLAHYGIAALDRTPALEEACYRIALSQQRIAAQRAAVTAILDRRLDVADDLAGNVPADFREVLDHLETTMEGRDQVLADLARQVRYRYYDEPVIAQAREATYSEMAEHLAVLASAPDAPERAERIRTLVACPQALAPMLSARMRAADPALRQALLETMTRRYYRTGALSPFHETSVEGVDFLCSELERDGDTRRLATAFVELEAAEPAARALGELAVGGNPRVRLVADFYAAHPEPALPREELRSRLHEAIEEASLPAQVEQVVFAVAESARGRGMSAIDFATFRRATEGGFREDASMRGLHPMMAERLRLWRLAEFDLAQLGSAEDVYLYHGVSRENPKDERLFGVAEVRDLTPIRDDAGRLQGLPEMERVLVEALEAMRAFQGPRDPRRRLLWNRVLLYAWPTIEFAAEEIRGVIDRYARATGGLGIEMVELRGAMREEDGGERERELRFFSPTGRGVVVEVDDPPTHPLQPLDEGARRVVQARRRGTVHPAELIKLLAPARGEDRHGGGRPPGDFLEHDLDADGRLAPVSRGPALNEASVVVGLVRNHTERYPEGMQRVALLSDPTRALGSLAEPECTRIIAALDLAEELGVPVEWFALSAGAMIAMDSGTENMDWIAAVLRRIIEFTQRGNELNVVVTGINVGAQPYWNAEATMLMHTRGILVMTPESAMVLTGKQALDYSGGVSAEDNFGIGGYERIMGPNGQAQYWAPDLAGACRVLLSHYEHTYVAPGERFPRRAETTDPSERDVRGSPHSAPGSDLREVGEIFSDDTNPGRKKPFDIRSVMRATVDRDRPPLERWAGWREADNAVVWDAHLGGWPVSVLGVESRPLPRHGPLPADGPEQWTPGTLFPQSSRKIARAINAASGRRPVVVLANLAGFDGSPESMAHWQLEYGAEIGRAVVNFRGPIVFCVVSRYHGGAFVVFSQRLNDDLEAVALEGSHASVIGGAPAAAVVFAQEVRRRATQDARIAELDQRIDAAEGAERQRLRAERAVAWSEVHAQELGALAAEFDSTHSVERALRMGSVSRIIAPASLRPFLIDAVERGIRRTLKREDAGHVLAGLADPFVR